MASLSKLLCTALAWGACGAVFAQSNALTPGTLSSAATTQSIGLEWPISGDADHDATGTVRYRVLGEASWRDAMPLVRVHDTRRPPDVNTLAGSIMFLQPSTTYEVEVSIADPDGGSARETVNVQTRSPPLLPSGGAQLHVVPGGGGGDGSQSNPFQGLESAWAAARPGDEIIVHAGDYGGVRDRNARSGTPGRPIVFRAAGDGEAVFSFIEVFTQSHLWFEGLVFRHDGSSDTGFYSSLLNPGYDQGFQPMQAQVDGIVLRRNRFFGFKHAIRLGPRTAGWFITDNFIVGNKTLGMSGTESFDGEGIELGRGSEHEIAYNSITLVGDGISAPSRNCDIYANDIYDVTDDGIELDNGEANTRAWGNRIHNPGHNGFSFQPQRGAPWYIVRNQVINTQESMIKFRDTDRFVMAHNTFINWDWVLNHWAGHLLRGITRNNLWISLASGPIWRRVDENISWRTDHDYDGFDWGSNGAPFDTLQGSIANLGELRAAIGQQRNGITIDSRSCFESLDVPGPPPLTTVPPQWATLAAGCNAVDAGEILPNLSDGFTGTAPDLGAIERDRPLPHYGVRDAAQLMPPAAPSDLQVR